MTRWLACTTTSSAVPHLACNVLLYLLSSIAATSDISPAIPSIPLVATMPPLYNAVGTILQPRELILCQKEAHNTFPYHLAFKLASISSISSPASFTHLLAKNLKNYLATLPPPDPPSPSWHPPTTVATPNRSIQQSVTPDDTADPNIPQKWDLCVSPFWVTLWSGCSFLPPVR
jgi:hypothetical protein